MKHEIQAWTKTKGAGYSGPIICGTVGGCGGMFVLYVDNHLDIIKASRDSFQGLDAIKTDLHWNIFSALIASVFVTLMVCRK